MTGDRERPVLIVEDDRDIRELLRRLIERRGVTVLESSTGEAALELARAERPGLIVLDILLPGIDGWEVLRQIRDDPQLAGARIVIVSIVDDPGANERPPVEAYLRKPFRAASVDRMLDELLPAPPLPPTPSPIRLETHDAPRPGR